MKNLDNSSVINLENWPSRHDRWVVPFTNFSAQYDEERQQIAEIVERIFSSGLFVGDSVSDDFESAVANYLAVENVVSVGSGTDALILALKVAGVGPGDEVITPSNSHFSSTSCIIQNGATPVFADVGSDQNLDPKTVEAAITPATKAIMPVHLTGRPADMDALLLLAGKRQILVIEDAAQAIGAKYRDRNCGTFGHLAAFSAHPLKLLNAAGDGGFITTRDADFSARLRRLRNNGLLGRDKVLEWGTVSRMDALQAEILKMRLLKLDVIINKRRALAGVYRNAIHAEDVILPPERDFEFHTYQNFVIQVDRRDELKLFLEQNGIQTAVHYPTPIHLQPPATPFGFGPGSLPVTEQQATKILSLPINQYLAERDIAYVADAVNKFYIGV